MDGDRDPLFAFGHGLSYTTFDYTDLSIYPTVLTDPATDHVTVSVMVTNNGSRDGEEVVQLYLRDEVSSVTTPIIELRRWARVPISKGQSQLVTLQLNVPQDLQVFSQNEQFVVENGNFTLFVAASSADLRLNTTLVVSLPSAANKWRHSHKPLLHPLGPL